MTTETRTGRGIRLFRECGAEIREVEPGVYRVPSTTGRGYYRADLATGTCECADHEHRGAFCLHLVAATVAEAKRRCRRRTTTERPSRRHDGRTERPQEQPDGQRRGSGPSRRDGSLRGVLADPARLEELAERLGV